MIEFIIRKSLNSIFLVLTIFALLIGASVWAVKNTPLDAIPDLTPPQIIVSVKWQGQSPQIIEDQIIYPLTSELMAVAGTKTVRAFSSFENALVYVIFDDKVDMYWARDRISEVIAQTQKGFPADAMVKLGPDATGIGWVYEYALKSSTKTLDELRTLQEYYYKYALLGVSGVSEVATIGGFERNYQVTLDEARMVQYGLTPLDVKKALQNNNRDTGGRIVVENGFETIIQAHGFAKNAKELEAIVLKNEGKTPLTIGDVARIDLVPSYRRGMADLNGQGEVVGGIVVARYGENAYRVIQDVKAKLASLAMEGVEVVPAYDRSDLIDKAIDTLKHTLAEEYVIVLAVIALFLFHFRSSLIVIVVLPLIILLTFLLMKLFGMESNIMSLGGIAIAIGAMVDACIVMIENAHKHLQGRGNLPFRERFEIIYESSKQVGRPIFFALMLIVVSFLPIFALSGQEGALFHPLAFTKTFAMLSGAIVSITLVPVLVLLFIKGEIKDEHANPVNRFFIFLYTPILKGAIAVRVALIVLAVAAVVYGGWLYNKQKWEFMPPTNEQTFMYMPVTPYGIGIDQAKELTQKTDKLLADFPEVKTVFGKAGRADTATDPAPLSMIETIVTFKDPGEWREGVTYESLLREMESKIQVMGLVNSWTYPIRGRIDMLLTGIRTPLGIKLYGDDSATLEAVAKQIETTLSGYEGSKSVFADKSNAGYFINIDVNQTLVAQYGITKEAVMAYVGAAIGGGTVSVLYDGIERYPISLRYAKEDRRDMERIKRIRIKTPYGYIPLEQLARVYHENSPSVLKSEKGKKVTFIYITPQTGTTSDTYKQDATKLLESVTMPPGYYIEWAGESEYLDKAMKRLAFIIPITLVITFVLIYFALGNLTNSVLVFATLPFAALGGIVYVDWLDYNFSVAVIVGFLALIGVAAETAIVMIIYLEEALKKVTVRTKENIRAAVYEGAVLRVRPKLMTVFSTLLGLFPIMLSSGVGSEVMQRIAAPMIGGMVSSTLLTLIIVPALFYMIHASKDRGAS